MEIVIILSYQTGGPICKHPIPSVDRNILSIGKTLVTTVLPLVWRQEILRRHLGVDPSLA